MSNLEELADRFLLAEWLIVLLSLPDPPPESAGLLGEAAAAHAIRDLAAFLSDSAARQEVERVISPLVARTQEQLKKSFEHSTEQKEMITLSANSGIGGISEWDALAMARAMLRQLLAGRRHKVE